MSVFWLEIIFISVLLSILLSSPYLDFFLSFLSVFASASHIKWSRVRWNVYNDHILVKFVLCRAKNIKKQGKKDKKVLHLFLVAKLLYKS